jgi:hypothetical protein
MTENPLRPLHFGAFVMNTTGHVIQGTWRRPRARQFEASIWVPFGTQEVAAT